MKQAIFGGSDWTLDTGVTKYNTLLDGYYRGSTESDFSQVVSTGGIIKNLRVKLDGSPGGGKSYTFTLMLNGAPTALTVEIADAATTGNNVADEIVVSAGQTVSLRCVPSGTPTARKCYNAVIFEGDTANESLILGSTFKGNVSPSATQYAQVMGRTSDFRINEDSCRQVVPTAGIIKNLYVVLDVDPGDIGVDGYKFTLRLNGATVGESLIVTITANDTTGDDTAHNLVVSAGDILTLMIEPLNTPSVTPKAKWGMTFVADTEGESIILGGSFVDLDDTATEYNRLTSAESFAWVGTEPSVYQLGQACILKKLYMKLSAAPGAGNKYTFTVRIAGTSSNVVTEIADTATAGNSGALEDTIADDEYVNLMVVPDGTPDVVGAYWGLVSYREPPLISAPTVTTQAVTSILTTTATGNGNITDTGGENCSTRGFDWDTDSGAPYANSVTESNSYGTGAYTLSLTSLPPATLIYYRAKATNTAGWGYGGEETFTTGTVRTKALSDTVNISDAFSYVRGLFKTLSDTITISDAFAYLKGLTKTLTDTIGITDSFSKVSVFYKSFTDTVNIGDSFAKVTAFIKTLTDSLNITDSIVKAVGLIKTETIAITDVIVKVVTIIKTFSDGIGITDSLSKSVGIFKADTVTIADAVVKAISIIRADSLAIVDSVAKAVSIVKTETIAIVDYITLIFHPIVLKLKKRIFAFTLKARSFAFHLKER